MAENVKELSFMQMMTSLGPSPFQFNIDDGNCAIKWKNWLRGFELFAKASGIDKNPNKVEWLLTCSGPKVQEIFFNLPDNETVEERAEDREDQELKDPQESYQEAVRKLNDFFAPKRNASFERYIFRKIHRKSNERFDAFLMRLRVQAERCDFGTQSDANIKDQVIIGCDLERLRNKLLERGDESLESIVKMAKVYEAVADQQKVFADEKQSSKLQSTEEVCKIGTYQNKKRKIDLPINRKFNSNDECSRCGFNGHKGSDLKCPAKGKKCNHCGRMDHFARKCYLKNADDNYEPKQKIRNESVRMIQPTKPTERPTQPYGLKEEHVRAVQASPNSTSCTVGTPVGEYEDIFCIFSKDSSENQIWCSIGGVVTEVVVDSGTRYNIIDRETWMEMKNKLIRITRFSREVDIGFLAYGGHKLNFLGMFNAEIQVQEKKILANFYVADEVGKPLLGYETAKLIGILKIGADVNQINAREKQEQELSKIKGIMVEIPVDKNVRPVQQPYRRVPVPVEKMVNEKIESMLREGIIEPVNTSTWISPLVMQPKPDGDIRICVDMRRANEAVVREYHPMPTMEEFLPYIAGATVFSKIDVRQAFHQVLLSPSSREITTFLTKKGLFRYKRLMFGISCAPEIFQKIMEQLLRGCSGCCIFMDDILIYGATKEQHDKNLAEILNRLKENNVTLNDKKCIYGVKSVTFLGHELSENGIRPTDDKVDSIKRFRAPETVEEVRSFLGLVNYVAKFIPDLATTADPLRQLTRSGTPFEWKVQQQHAFDTLKTQLTKSTTLGYYNVNDKTRIIADASPTGLGAVLVQFQASGPRVISYASRSLNETERKYAQPEREALALVWALERFHFYVFGREVEVVTDHQSLEKIFSSKSQPCARIERWVLRLQAYKYKVIYQPGKTNIADALSRLVEENVSDVNDVTTSADDEQYINWIVAQAEPKAIKSEEIAEASKHDKAILAVRNGICENDWTNKEASPYRPFETEFCFVGDILLRTTRIVLPECFWQHAMELAHEGHPGMSVMKKRLRAKVWWPKMDQQIENFVRKCKSCTLVSAPSTPEPMKRRELPSAAWEHLAIDYLGPLPSGHYLLVVVDYYSRYIEVEIANGNANSTGSTETIKRLKRIFARFGLPLSIQADNAKQFVSNEFEQYCNVNNIHLNSTIPYWPQQNGEVERQNRSLLKRLQISQAEKRNWIDDLQDYLLMYRSTAHSTTLKSPAELLFNRKIRDKLPSMLEMFINDEEVRDRDKEAKFNGKRYADEMRNAKISEIKEGDEVLVKREISGNKLSTMFEPTIYKVVKRNGSEIIVENEETSSRYRRNVAHAKKYITDEAPQITGRCKQQPQGATCAQQKISQPQDLTLSGMETELRQEPMEDNLVSDTEFRQELMDNNLASNKQIAKDEEGQGKESLEQPKGMMEDQLELPEQTIGGKRARMMPRKFADYVLKNVESINEEEGFEE